MIRNKKLSDEDSDHFSVDSLDDQETELTSSSNCAYLPMAVKSNQISTSMFDQRNKNLSNDNFSVPFYCINRPIRDVENTRQLNMKYKPRSKSLTTTKPSIDHKKMELRKRIERWNDEVHLNNKMNIPSKSGTEIYADTHEDDKHFWRSWTSECSQTSMISFSHGHILTNSAPSEKSLHGKPRGISYLDQYRLRKYGRRQSPDGMNFSSTVISLPSDLQNVWKAGDNEEQSYNDFVHGVCDINLSSSNETTESVDIISKSETCVKTKRVPAVIPYTMKDYSTLLPTKLGHLGPDLTISQEKMNKLKKQHEYGLMVNKRNLEAIRAKKLKMKLSEKHPKPPEKSAAHAIRNPPKQEKPACNVLNQRIMKKASSTENVKPSVKVEESNRIRVPFTLHRSRHDIRQTETNMGDILKMQERHMREVETISEIFREGNNIPP